MPGETLEFRYGRDESSMTPIPNATPNQGDDWLYNLTKTYFGDLGPEVVDTMYQIALAESGGNPNAYNGVGLDNSHGLWQINVHPQANPDLAGLDLTDPATNAQAARQIYDRQGPTAWSTYSGVIGGKQKEAPSEMGVINALVESLMENQPQPGDFTDKADAQGVVYDSASDQYQEAITNWMTSLQTAISLKQSYAEEEAGIFRMEDGQIITREQMDQLTLNDPAAAAQISAYVANKNIERENEFSQIINELGLTEFQVGQQSAGLENNRRSTDFQNQMEAYREGIALDQANQNTAVTKIDRQLSGMAESRARATEAMDALMKAAPWGTTNGKTSFTPSDLGGAVSTMARFGGVGANDPLMNFTGVQTIDPNSMFNFYDQQLGVSGPLPQITDLDPKWASMIPQAPGSIPIQQGSPTFARPQAPVPTPMPQGTPPTPLPTVGNEILRNILNMYGGMLGR